MINYFPIPNEGSESGVVVNLLYNIRGFPNLIE